MAVIVAIIGESGAGKTCSLRNFSPAEIGVLNVAAKPLPFKSNIKTVNKPSYDTIRRVLERNKLNAYVIDDSNYLMSDESFQKANQKGYEKFTEMAVHYKQMLDSAIAANDDTIVYVMSHPEADEQSGRIRPKTIGKMLSQQLCIEGLYTIVLYAYADRTGYHFATRTDGITPAKAPMGMFADDVIDNDLKYVDTAIREYYGLAPLSPAKEASTNDAD